MSLADPLCYFSRASLQEWMEQQQKLWQEWVQRMQGAAGGSGAPASWSQGMDQWQKAVEHTLETQRQALHVWADQVASVDGTPEDMQRWASEGVQMKAPLVLSILAPLGASRRL